MAIDLFESIPIKESNEPLVDLSGFDFALEPSYFEQHLSHERKMYLRQGVVNKLIDIQTDLKRYKFKIWDGFRPREVQNNIYQKYWKELQVQHPEWGDEKLKSEVETFITNALNPKRIPPHATGGAVDLTLVDLSGKELDMGTGFDYFGPEASSLFFEEHQQNELVRQNRKILREAMIATDFKIEPYEWWHFDYGNQRWALDLNKPYAIYGEIDPNQ